jgi:NADH:ubiquinone oxidoreductase subunit D
LRSTGVNWDLRKTTPYEVYHKVNFNVPVGKNGDCYDRYLLRVQEMRESLNIMLQCIENLPAGPIKIDNNKIVPPSRLHVKASMEALISHFKLYSEGFFLKKSETYVAVESSKGEFGVFLVSDGTNKPYRVAIRCPGFSHLQGLDFLSKNHLIADVVTNIGTIDIVLGSIDR